MRIKVTSEKLKRDKGSRKGLFFNHSFTVFNINLKQFGKRLRFNTARWWILTHYIFF